MITSARLAPVKLTNTWAYRSFNDHHGVLSSIYLITIARQYINEHRGIYNISLKDKRHTTDIIKYAIQVKSLSEQDIFKVIVNNRTTQQNKYRLLIRCNMIGKQYGRPSKMVDVSIWRIFQIGGFSIKKPIWREFQY